MRRWRSRWWRRSIRGVVAAALASPAGPVAAQESGEEGETGWAYTAELSFVLTAGNASSSTLGAGAGATRTWERTELRFQAAGLRTETSRTTRTAVGSPDDFEIVERSESEVTAESYSARARLEHQVSSRLYGFGAAGWERNTFSGFDARFSFAAGAGKTWVDREGHRFATDLGLTVTRQEDVVNEGDGTRTFGGLRAGWEYERRLTETAEVESVLAVDGNLSEVEDLRADLTNALGVRISRALQLRTSLQLLWDNRPALVEIPLQAPDGTPAGATVRAPLEELDTRFQVALVASF